MMTNKRSKKQIVGLKADAPKPFSRSGPFRFLDLPREVRDMVYHHVVLPPVSEYLGARPKMHSYIRTELDYPPLRVSSNRTAILQTSKQVCEESKKVLYEEPIYQVDLTLKHWCFDVFEPEIYNDDPTVLSGGEKYHEQWADDRNDTWLLDGMAGIPEWNLSAIRKLHITINLCRYTHAKDEEFGYAPYRILEKISVRALHGMKNLRNLRISIIHGWLPPELQGFFQGITYAPLKMRELMRKLIGSIPKTVKTVRWGLTEEEIRKEYPNPPRAHRHTAPPSSMTFGLINSGLKHTQHVRAEVLKPLVKEFEVLRGMDAEYYSTPLES
ncbi:uncharacterized protein BDZ99DRAFT_231256 [Mytilinidion resinicola]|uniref:Uncharacterized protein n=1 Tax=Mytilinidion resinicola TaxID=574789 RepID=A0A6A6YYS2_9PEZI|nr:uncharacterized protein BDZ99DRAFT_231256 [Mytilinidion resinicola]KAF2814086.1 hypothetical protein BDZ99DRAFT_231256 [Mytilinidion resinicola]